MTKARDLANIISGGAVLADGAIAVSEVTGLHAVASSGAASDVTGLATVATSGAYSDVTGTPTLGTASALDVGTSATNVVQLDGTGKIPAVDGSQITGVSSTAIGELAYFSEGGTSTADSSWLECDGSVKNRSAYPNLVAAIGNIVNGINNVSSDKAFGNTIGYGPSAHSHVRKYNGVWYFIIGTYAVTSTDLVNFTTTNVGVTVGADGEVGYDGTNVAYGNSGMIAYTSNNGASWNTYSHSDTYNVRSIAWDAAGSYWRSHYLFGRNGRTSDITDSSAWNSQGTLGYLNTSVFTSMGSSSNNSFSCYAGAQQQGSSNTACVIVWANGGGATIRQLGNSQNGRVDHVVGNSSALICLSPSDGRIYYSTNGSTFGNVANPLPTGIQNMGKMGETLFVNDVRGNISTSTNGSTWSSVVNQKNAYIQNNGNHGTFYDGSTYIQGNPYFGFVKNTSWPTATGWTTIGNNANITGHEWKASLWDGSKYVAVSPNYGVFATSTDGNTFTIVNHDMPTSGSHRALAYGNSTYVVGYESSGALYSSSNLTSWTSRTTNISSGIYASAYLNNTWFIGGYGGEIAKTSDITTAFTVVRTASGSQISGFAYGNSKYVATASNGVHYYSSDGTTWSSGAANNGYYKGVIFAANRFIAFGQNSSKSAIYASTDGVAFEAVFSDTNSGNMQSVIFANGVFVALDSERSLFVSSDGLNWTKQTNNTSAYGQLVTDGTTILVLNGRGTHTPFYTYNSSTQFVVPNKGSASISDGVNQLYIKATS